jgi:hypothetical protein
MKLGKLSTGPNLIENRLRCSRGTCENISEALKDWDGGVDEVDDDGRHARLLKLRQLRKDSMLVIGKRDRDSRSGSGHVVSE